MLHHEDHEVNGLINSVFLRALRGESTLLVNALSMQILMQRLISSINEFTRALREHKLLKTEYRHQNHPS